MKGILVIEPYMGGSHSQFIMGLMDHVEGRYSVLAMSDRAWKTKMQLAAGWCLEEIRGRCLGGQEFDIVLCSTFVDLAVLRALLSRERWWNPSTRYYLYFHENQLAYPTHLQQSKNLQYALINFNSAMAADCIAFNSEFNRQTFLSGCKAYLDKFPEFGLDAVLARINAKSVVLHPPIPFNLIDRCPVKKQVDTPVVVWNHRWEHDKGVAQFYDILMSIKRAGTDFRLILLGKAHRETRALQEKFQKSFSSEIIHCGYADSAQQYSELLCRGDIVVSTASHEFFGIAVAEAIRAGCLPVLPDNLSYKELYPFEYLYKEGGCLEMLQGRLAVKRRLIPAQSRALTERFTWQALYKRYVQWFEEGEISPDLRDD